MKQPCPFCKPQLEAARILAETEQSFALMSNPRMMPYHALVLPKRHVWQPWELTSAETTSIQQQISQLQQILFDKFSLGSDIRQQFRPFIEASRYHNIRHIHFHVLPRALDDELYRLSGRHEPFEHVDERAIKQSEDDLR